MNRVLGANTAGKSVVLIHDSLDSHANLADHLREYELLVTEFRSFDQARDHILQNPPHAIIADLHLPQFDGIAVLRFANDLEVPVPVILVAGDDNVADVVQALRLGAADYLIKPILDYDVIVHSINRVLNVVELQLEIADNKHRLEQMNRELKDYIQLLERDQQAAKQVQSNLLPISPATYGGIELSHRVIPSLYLSGDFVDYGYVHQRYIAFYLTDVSGHGASSAFVTVWLKQLVRRLFRERQLFKTREAFDTAPAELLAVINHELMQSRFFSHLTCVVGVIDTESLEMRYVLAGHLPLPILIGPNGHAEYLHGRGKPVGLFQDARWEVNKVQLPKGFQLAMFSDGILETLPSGGLIERETSLIEALQGVTKALSLDEIAQRLHLDSDREVPDDIAMVLIKQLAV